MLPLHAPRCALAWSVRQDTATLDFVGCASAVHPSHSSTEYSCRPRHRDCDNPVACADFRGELRRLNRELLFAFTDMLAAVAGRPSQSARSVELVGVLARNLQHLLNLLRPHQVSVVKRRLGGSWNAPAMNLQRVCAIPVAPARPAAAALGGSGFCQYLTPSVALDLRGSWPPLSRSLCSIGRSRPHWHACCACCANTKAPRPPSLASQCRRQPPWSTSCSGSSRSSRKQWRSSGAAPS